MIERVEVRNYQSHHDTTIELAPFTVLVGPSSAGKSALTRALRALTSNQAGKDFITHGETTAQVSVRTDKGTVTLTKGKPEDSYVILANDDIKNPKRYTKLGGSVPEDVSTFLGIDAKDPINFAGQLDMPFLLKTSAAEVARVLGELTGVSAVFEASRESLRRKNSFVATYKTRTNDLETLKPRLAVLLDLEKRLAALDAAETAYNTAEALQSRLDALMTLLQRLNVASSRLKTAQRATSAPLPDVSAAVTLLSRLQTLNGLLASLSNHAATLKQAQAGIENSKGLTATLELEYDEVLQLAGTCPTCGQSTEGIHVHVS
jgi:DNA repair exonuclease SbcCD ATPase subunit